jgi:tRNA(Arg) A34 adenosine deaminase TadA
MTDEQFMLLAIEEARRGMADGQSPFGAVIVRDGRVVAAGHNNVNGDMDATAHGEITAIRAACRKLGTVDLSGCTIYSTTEPCPMCFAAIHWARIGRIVYGCTIPDALAAGFSELTISNETMANLGRAKVQITPNVLREQCLPMFQEYTGPRY